MTVRVTIERRAIRISLPRSVPGANGQGVPIGGTTGQVLTKLSATDYATEWANPGASSNYESYPAGQNLSSGRVVVVDSGEAFYFNPADITHHGRAFGITKTSASIGASVTIQPAYTVGIDAAFTFPPDVALWVDLDGEVTDTIDPAWLVLQRAGVSLENDKMLIDFSLSIKKA